MDITMLRSMTFSCDGGGKKSYLALKMKGENSKMPLSFPFFSKCSLQRDEHGIYLLKARHIIAQEGLAKGIYVKQ